MKTIVFVGAPGSGKTSLIAACSKHLATSNGEAETSFSKMFYADETNGSTKHNKYVNHNDYLFIDTPGHLKYSQNTIAGITQSDLGVIVVDANDGPTEETREHAILLRHNGIKKFVIFINKIDVIDDGELQQQIANETKQMLFNLDFTDDNFQILFGQTINDVVCLTKLFDAFKNMTISEKNNPFEIISINHGIVFGRVGETIKVGDTLFHEDHGYTIIELQVNHKRVKQATDKVVGMTLNGDTSRLSRGDVLSSKKYSPASNFKGELFLLSKEDGGRWHKWTDTYKPNLIKSSFSTSVKIQYVSAIETDKIINAQFTLDKATYVQPNTKFILRENNRTIGIGIIREVIG